MLGFLTGQLAATRWTNIIGLMIDMTPVQVFNILEFMRATR